MKLVVMIGPNGSGKSSVLEALQFLRLLNGFSTLRGSGDYYLKSSQDPDNRYVEILRRDLKIEIYGKSPMSQKDWKKAFQVRSSYRNDLAAESNQPDPAHRELLNQKQHRLVENDASVMANYCWLQSQWAELSSHIEGSEETKKSLQDRVLGGLRAAMGRLFDEPKLILTGLGNLLGGRIFQFKKRLKPRIFIYESIQWRKSDFRSTSGSSSCKGPI